MFPRGKSPHYDLAEIKAMMRDGVHISAAVRETARDDFGWEYQDMEHILGKLRRKHFFKSAPHKVLPGTIVDIYKVRRFRGMDVYLHFHTEFDGDRCVLVLGSFHRLEE